MRPSLIDEQIKRIDFGQFIIDDDTFVTDCLPNYRQLLAKPQLLTKPPLLAKTGFPADAQLLSQHRGQQKQASLKLTTHTPRNSFSSPNKSPTHSLKNIVPKSRLDLQNYLKIGIVGQKVRDNKSQSIANKISYPQIRENRSASQTLGLRRQTNPEQISLQQTYSPPNAFPARRRSLKCMGLQWKAMNKSKSQISNPNSGEGKLRLQMLNLFARPGSQQAQLRFRKAPKGNNHPASFLRFTGSQHDDTIVKGVKIIVRQE